jgi:hypothetical protein
VAARCSRLSLYVAAELAEQKRDANTSAVNQLLVLFMCWRNL